MKNNNTNFKKSTNNYGREFISGICGAAGALLFNMVATAIQNKISESKVKDLATRRVITERGLGQYEIWSRRAAEKAFKKGLIDKGVYDSLMKAFNDIENGFSRVYEAQDPTTGMVEAIIENC